MTDPVSIRGTEPDPRPIEERWASDESIAWDVIVEPRSSGLDN